MNLFGWLKNLFTGKGGHERKLTRSNAGGSASHNSTQQGMAPDPIPYRVTSLPEPEEEFLGSVMDNHFQGRINHGPGELPLFMNDPVGQSLVKAANASPEDPMPRHALADWLEEQGEDRVANWIRESIGKTERLPLAVAREVGFRWWPISHIKNGVPEIGIDQKKRFENSRYTLAFQSGC